MKQISFFLLIIFTLLLGACSATDSSNQQSNTNETAFALHFKGESKNWFSEYKIEKEDEHAAQFVRTITLSYKGTDINSVGDIHFEIDAGVQKTSGNMIYDGEITLKTEGTNNAIPSKDEIIKVTITWQGMTETFELRYY